MRLRPTASHFKCDLTRFDSTYTRQHQYKGTQILIHASNGIRTHNPIPQESTFHTARPLKLAREYRQRGITLRNILVTIYTVTGTVQLLTLSANCTYFRTILLINIIPSLLVINLLVFLTVTNHVLCPVRT